MTKEATKLGMIGRNDVNVLQGFDAIVVFSWRAKIWNRLPDEERSTGLLQRFASMHDVCDELNAPLW